MRLWRARDLHDAWWRDATLREDLEVALRTIWRYSTLRHACQMQSGQSQGGSGECMTGGGKHARDVGLVMILKNENETIQETLASLRDHIDYWTIVDTGSTGE